MIITHHGLEFFKVQFGDTIVAFNPPSKDSKFKSARFNADIVLVSLGHKDFNGSDTLSSGEKNPFVINGPGEYEVGGVFIKGFSTSSSYDGGKLINTAYILRLENMNLCFLGAVDSVELSQELKENLDDIDVLFVPIGDEGVLEPSEAYKLAVKIQPKIIIPMHYNGDGSYLRTFLKEEGTSKLNPVEKLTVRPKDLSGKEGEIVILSEK